MEFLIEFEVNVPDSAPASEVEARNSAEASAASRDGTLVLIKPVSGVNRTPGDLKENPRS